MAQFETSPEFINDLIRLALQCTRAGGTGCTFRTPEIDGECMVVDLNFKMITKDKKGR